MNNKYLTYTLEDLLDDAGFIDFVLYGNKKKEWESLFSESPDLRDNASKARKIFETLRDSKDEISEEEVVTIWKNIVRYDAISRRPGRKRILHSVMRYAAVMLILISAGIVVWYFIPDLKEIPEFQFSETLTVPSTGETRLILQSGEEIMIEKDQSEVAVNASGDIVINQQQIIQTGKAGPGKHVAMNEVVVPYGKRTQLQLADGTKVWLNSGSRMAFPSEFSGKRREVFLEGEAYFEVAHSASQLFLVKVRDITVKVLGTRFNLTAFSNGATIETVLLEGSVALTENKATSGKSKETILMPFQKASFSKDNRLFSIDPINDAELYTAWTAGWFRFSQDNLISVLRKLERYYNVSIESRDDFSDDGLISGKLDLKDSLEQVLKALADVAGFEFTIHENFVTVYKPITKLPMKK